MEASDFHDPANLVLLMAVDLWRTDAGLAALLPQVDFVPSDDPAAVGWQLQLTMLRAHERGESAAAVAAAEASMHPDVRDAATRSDLAVLWPAAVRLALTAGTPQRRPGSATRSPLCRPSGSVRCRTRPSCCCGRASRSPPTVTRA